MSVSLAPALRTERVPIMMTKEEVVALDDWRFANRIDSRSDAIRKLVRAGLDAESKAPADVGA